MEKKNFSQFIESYLDFMVLQCAHQCHNLMNKWHAIPNGELMQIKLFGLQLQRIVHFVFIFPTINRIKISQCKCARAIAAQCLAQCTQWT